MTSGCAVPGNLTIIQARNSLRMPRRHRGSNDSEYTIHVPGDDREAQSVHLIPGPTNPFTTPDCYKDCYNKLLQN